MEQRQHAGRLGVLKINDGVNGTIVLNGNNVVFASPIESGPPEPALTKTGGGTLYLTAL